MRLLLVALLAGCGLPSSSTSRPATVDTVVAERCAPCHGVGKLAVPLFPALGPLMLAKVDARLMPPGQPDATSLPMVDDPRLTADEIALFHAWRAYGYPELSPAPATPADPGDALLMMAGKYRPPQGSDSFRCFYLPAGAWRGKWLSGTAWEIGNAPRMHHIAGATIDDAGASAAQAIDATSPELGWPCPTDWGVPVVASLGAGSVTATSFAGLPKDAGIEVLAGFVLQVHYVTGAGDDQSGIRLKFHATPPPKKVIDVGVVAPSELPCPAGYSSDPSNSCSRAKALSSTTWSAAQALKTNDANLAGCGYTLASYYAAMPFQSTPEDHFLVPSHCSLTLPIDGEVISADIHMHTRGHRSSLSVGGKRLLGFSPYRWAWERKFSLASPARVRAGDQLYLEGEIDNGRAAQWSAVTGEPGFDGPAQPPLMPPAYLAMSYDKFTEMFVATISVAAPRQ